MCFDTNDYCFGRCLTRQQRLLTQHLNLSCKLTMMILVNVRHEDCFMIRNDDDSDDCLFAFIVASSFLLFMLFSPRMIFETQFQTPWLPKRLGKTCGAKLDHCMTSSCFDLHFVWKKKENVRDKRNCILSEWGRRASKNSRQFKWKMTITTTFETTADITDLMAVILIYSILYTVWCSLWKNDWNKEWQINSSQSFMTTNFSFSLFRQQTHCCCLLCLHFESSSFPAHILYIKVRYLFSWRHISHFRLLLYTLLCYHHVYWVSIQLTLQSVARFLLLCVRFLVSSLGCSCLFLTVIITSNWFSFKIQWNDTEKNDTTNSFSQSP